MSLSLKRAEHDARHPRNVRPTFRFSMHPDLVGITPRLEPDPLLALLLASAYAQRHGATKRRRLSQRIRARWPGEVTRFLARPGSQLRHALPQPSDQSLVLDQCLVALGQQQQEGADSEICNKRAGCSSGFEAELSGHKATDDAQSRSSPTTERLPA